MANFLVSSDECFPLLRSWLTCRRAQTVFWDSGGARFDFRPPKSQQTLSAWITGSHARVHVTLYNPLPCALHISRVQLITSGAPVTARAVSVELPPRASESVVLEVVGMDRGEVVVTGVSVDHHGFRQQVQPRRSSKTSAALRQPGRGITLPVHMQLVDPPPRVRVQMAASWVCTSPSAPLVPSAVGVLPPGSMDPSLRRTELVDCTIPSVGSPARVRPTVLTLVEGERCDVDVWLSNVSSQAATVSELSVTTVPSELSTLFTCTVPALPVILPPGERLACRVHIRAVFSEESSECRLTVNVGTRGIVERSGVNALVLSETAKCEVVLRVQRLLQPLSWSAERMDHSEEAVAFVHQRNDAEAMRRLGVMWFRAAGEASWMERARAGGDEHAQSATVLYADHDDVSVLKRRGFAAIRVSCAVHSVADCRLPVLVRMVLPCCMACASPGRVFEEPMGSPVGRALASTGSAVPPTPTAWPSTLRQFSEQGSEGSLAAASGAPSESWPSCRVHAAQRLVWVVSTVQTVAQAGSVVVLTTAVPRGIRAEAMDAVREALQVVWACPTSLRTGICYPVRTLPRDESVMRELQSARVWLELRDDTAARAGEWTDVHVYGWRDASVSEAVWVSVRLEPADGVLMSGRRRWKMSGGESRTTVRVMGMQTGRCEIRCTAEGPGGVLMQRIGQFEWR
jgi:hypothetical protein